MVSRGSLLKKIVLVQVVVVFLVMAAMGYRDYHSTAEQLTKSLTETAEHVAERAAGGLELHMWNFDHDAAASLLGAELVSEHVIGFVVEEEDGESLWLALGTDEDNEPIRLDSPQEAESLQEQALFAVEEPILHGDEQLGTLNVLLTGAAMERQLTEQRNGIIIDMLTLGIVLTITLTLVLQLTVVKPVRRIVLRLRDIAEGDADLTQKLAITTRDELGEFSALFNQFVDTIQSLAVRIKTSVRETAHATGTVQEESQSAYGATENIATGLGQIRGSFQELAGDINDSTTAVEQILGNIDELRNVIETQASAVTEASASVEEMVSSIRNISDTTETKTQFVGTVEEKTDEGSNRIEETNSVVREIAADVDKTSEIVDVINGISAQTNLLAMNAAIEAAHAGESGKGFAVVAGEIRQLAESTSENAKMITDMLKNMVERIQRLEQTSGQTADVFYEIRSGVQDVRSSFKEISDAMNEMKNGTDNINEAMQSLNNISLEVKNGADEMQTGAGTINSSMQRVQSVSSQVGDQISKMENEGNAIIRAMESITSSVEASRHTISLLSEETSRFKTESAGETGGDDDREVRGDNGDNGETQS